MTEHSVTLFIRKLQEGDQSAATPIWNHFFTRLVADAHARLFPQVRRVTDGEDIAVAVFDSCFRGIAKGRFPNVQDRNNLWAILMMIAERKAINANRDAGAKIRGGGKVRGESVFRTGGDSSGPGLDGLAGSEPDPQFADDVVEECEVRIKGLPSDLAQVANLKLEGNTNIEIAKKLEISPATVDRRLERIRKLWDAER